MQFSCLLFCFLILTFFDKVVSERSDGVLDRIKTGLQFATNYLDKAKDIADLVSKSLGHKPKQNRGEEGDKPPNFGASNLASAFFRLLGLDSQKIAAIAVNSVIFLAQMISSLFDLKTPQESISRSFDDDNDEPLWNPMQFIMDNKNKRIQNLLRQAQDRQLPNQLIERVDGLDSACIRLLLCKTSPIINAAQESLRKKVENSTHRMTSWLPSRDDFERNSDECEDNYTDCRLFPESEV